MQLWFPFFQPPCPAVFCYSYRSTCTSCFWVVRSRLDFALLSSFFSTMNLCLYRPFLVQRPLSPSSRSNSTPSKWCLQSFSNYACLIGPSHRRLERMLWVEAALHNLNEVHWIHMLLWACPCFLVLILAWSNLSLLVELQGSVRIWA